MTDTTMINDEAVTPSIDRRWEAVVKRDASADGTFVYAVATTGVYCRPSCPSRQAKRENVTFFATAAEAAKAGFRSCKRCKPDGPSLTQDRAAAVAAACRMIDAADEMPKLDEIAGRIGLSKYHFHRVFKEAMGVTPRAYAVSRRAERVRGNLAAGGSVTNAFYGAGYNASSRFYEEASDHLGMTPKRYRDGGVGVTIRFAVGETSLGTVLVAATDKGICAIDLGDDPDGLVRDLQDRFPKAELVGGDEAFERTVAEVCGTVEDPSRSLDLPLDVRGTAFQHRVWKVLRSIPAGSTKTYSEIAEVIGQPKASRAVAQACATNQIAVAIPCHRVVRTDGSLSGYRWGVERKDALLTREREAA